MRLQAGQEGWTPQEPCIAGIDEAGRGPVLGPMVYAVALTPASREEELKSRRFADSKTLTEAQREALFAELEADEHVAFETCSASAQEISACMLSPAKVSLNQLANNMTFSLLDSLIARGVQLPQVFVDTVGDARAYEAKLLQRFPDIRFTVCPKADSLYPIVSAASIAAKVTRDRELRQAFPGVDSSIYGCGYPSDPATKAWMDSNVDPVFGFRDVVRFSWAPAATLLEGKGVPVRWPEEEEEGLVPGQQRLQFGVAAAGGTTAGSRSGSECCDISSTKASQGTGRHSFFRSRRLQRLRPLAVP